MENRLLNAYHDLREEFNKENNTDKAIIDKHGVTKQDFTNIREYIENTFDIKPIREFGENYAEYYRDGKNAIQKLINEAKAHKESGAEGEFNAQVAGAFYREGLGDIDLIWGEGRRQG